MGARTSHTGTFGLAERFKNVKTVDDLRCDMAGQQLGFASVFFMQVVDFFLCPDSCDTGETQSRPSIEIRCKVVTRHPEKRERQRQLAMIVFLAGVERDEADDCNCFCGPPADVSGSSCFERRELVSDLCKSSGTRSENQ